MIIKKPTINKDEMMIKYKIGIKFKLKKSR